ncbi:MAG: AAA family ATPase [Planctomycetaceae bacterium]|nr:AAA family ATPase [Planctomycetaceae bacterium]
MTTAETLNDLRKRILAGYPVLLLRTYEESRWEGELAELALELERGLVVWSLTSGAQPTISSESDNSRDVIEFLSQVEVAYPDEHLFLLKDAHLTFANPATVRKIRDLIPRLRQQAKTLLLMAPVDDLPVELFKDVTVVDLPIPGPDEIRGELQRIIAEPNAVVLEPSPREEDRLVQAVLGLTLAEARNAFLKVLQANEEVTDEIFVQLVAEKRHMVQGSNLLEFFDLEEGIDDIGGLDGLKEWILQRANAFTSDAASRGISNPKGVLLAGVQGCGKSLSAKAIARILGFPLVRMDLGALMESTRGASEQNLRDVLKLMEMISPSVLWLEEIDKAFAGVMDENSEDPTLARLLGRFLTWLQEHTAPVFVVATANNVSSLPPEILRRGRFDELFFVDLPNYHERQSIFSIHLSKRGWKPEKFDLDTLSTTTEGYSGSEIEQIVNSAVIESFAQGRVPTMDDLNEARERTVPLSVTMEDEIFHLREWARTRCRPATQDFRVMQVMEEEERRGEVPSPDQKEHPKWIELAEYGQLPAAIIEYIRLHDHVVWPQLLEDLSPYVETQGDFGMVVRADPKAVIWLRMSRELTDIFCEYLEGKRIYLHPVELSRFPEVTRPHLPAIPELPDQRVDKPVWLPTELRLLPPAKGTGRMGHVA